MSDCLVSKSICSDGAILDEELHFSVVATRDLTTAFLPLIAKSSEKKIAYISSVIGSLQQGGTWPALIDTYAISKAAMNMLVRKTALLLQSKGITVLSIHPGTLFHFIEKRHWLTVLTRLGARHGYRRDYYRVDEHVRPDCPQAHVRAIRGGRGQSHQGDAV